jgi:hypothetical protein
MRASPIPADAQKDYDGEAAAAPSQPAFKAYGSGAPNWFGCPIYVGFSLLAVAIIAPQIINPDPLQGFNGFLTRAMDRNIFPFAALGAFATWRAITWHLRGRYHDKLLVSADDRGICLPSGKILPYSEVRRIDPYSRDPGGGSDNWIEVADSRGSRWRIDVNMSVDPPKDILASLRDRALAGGASLTPERLNGLPLSGGSQLGYKEGLGWRG